MERASLAGIPQELFDEVCSKLPQYALTKLARVNKAINRKVQDSLYYHCVVHGFTKLSLFVRTMSSAAQYDRRGEVFSKNVRDLRLVLDPTMEEGNRATAVVLGRMVASVARYCPKIRTHLVLVNATCSSQPISSFSMETYPRVVSLIIYTGEGPPPAERQEPQGTQPIVYNSRVAGMGNRGGRSDTRCKPSAQFWTGIFNGTSFPHLEEVEIDHNYSSARSTFTPVVIPPDELKGLKNIRRLAVQSAPELNSSVLASALQCAPNLAQLELKFINGLEYRDLAKLIMFGLPGLKSFTLWVRPENNSARLSRDGLRYLDTLQTDDHSETSNHLCPLFRDFGKNTPHIDIYLPFVCRELFLTPGERAKLAEADVRCDVGTRDGGHSGKLDVNSTIAIVKEQRKSLAHARFQAVVKENMSEANKEGKNKAVSLAEYEVQQDNFKRERLIKNEKWKRVVRCAKRLCRSHESWEELGVLAALEEDNVTWVLGHERLNVAATFTGGSALATNEMKYEEQFSTIPAAESADRIAAMRNGLDYNDLMH